MCSKFGTKTFFLTWVRIPQFSICNPDRLTNIHSQLLFIHFNFTMYKLQHFLHWSIFAKTYPRY
uniref:Uncharacterized protein n=1 Tax=Anguilla anguilla TaxID=7936 RepID=A0A0E9X2B1_ANGAN